MSSLGFKAAEQTWQGNIYKLETMGKKNSLASERTLLAYQWITYMCHSDQCCLLIVL